MPIIDEFNLKASDQFPIAGTQEVTKNLELSVSAAATAGNVTGIVSSGGTPIADATVKIFDVNDNPIAHDLTNTVGRYTINQIPAGTYTIVAAKFMYITSVPISLSVVGNRPTTVNIELLPEPNAEKNTLFGIIRENISLTPIPDATVNIFRDVSGVQELELITHTDINGQYFAPALISGDYVVVGSKLGYDTSTSAPITLSGTEIDSLDLSLVVNFLQNVGTVSGIIKDITTLQPIPNAAVALYLVTGGTETITQITRTNSSGRYLFGDVHEGEYVVKAIGQTTSPTI